MSTDNYGAADWLLNDVGGIAPAPFERFERAILPWEKRCHALADVFGFSQDHQH